MQSHVARVCGVMLTCFVQSDTASCQQDVCVRGVRSNASGLFAMSFHQGVCRLNQQGICSVVSTECLVSCQHGMCVCACVSVRACVCMCVESFECCSYVLSFPSYATNNEISRCNLNVSPLYNQPMKC